MDQKGRVAIPAKMRNALNPEAKNTFTVTRGFEQCIFAYPLDRWERMEAEMEELNIYRSQTRNFIRSVLMYAEEVTLDAQGRVGVPKRLLQFAGIAGDALIIGALDHIEIWNPESFHDFQAEKMEDYETLAEKVMGSE